MMNEIALRRIDKIDRNLRNFSKNNKFEQQLAIICKDWGLARIGKNCVHFPCSISTIFEDLFNDE